MVRQFRDPAEYPRRLGERALPQVPQPRVLPDPAGVSEGVKESSRQPEEPVSLYPGPFVPEPAVPEGIYGTFGQEPFIASDAPPLPSRETRSEAGHFAEDYDKPDEHEPSLTLLQRLKNFFTGRKPEGAEFEELHAQVALPGFPVNGHVVQGHQHVPRPTSGFDRKVSMFDVEAIREMIEEEKKEEEEDYEDVDPRKQAEVEREIQDEVIQEILRPSVKRRSTMAVTRRKFAKELERYCRGEIL